MIRYLLALVIFGCVAQDRPSAARIIVQELVDVFQIDFLKYTICGQCYIPSVANFITFLAVEQFGRYVTF